MIALRGPYPRAVICFCLLWQAASVGCTATNEGSLNPQKLESSSPPSEQKSAEAKGQTDRPRVYGQWYPDSGAVQSVSDVSSDGTIVTLDDGSLWLIEEVDRIYTTLWLPLDKVRVHSRTIDVKGQTFEAYSLHHLEEDERVYARFIGHR